jgi:exodeoxyribonuclease-3
MLFYSWNVNGIRAAAGKDGFFPWLDGTKADVVALQETKARPDQLSPEILNPGRYLSYWSSAMVRNGYSGVAIYTLREPLSLARELPGPDWDKEGRLLQAEYPGFYFLNVYFPNGQRDEGRLSYKLGYYDAFLAHAQRLRKKKPIVVCGDFNTAHRPMDLARPKENEGTSGFLPVEREWLDKFVGKGYVDTFRHANGDSTGDYTWWSFRAGARRNNVGWRIDYFFVSEELKGAIRRSFIEPQVQGSDHCPIGLELDV